MYKRCAPSIRISYSLECVRRDHCQNFAQTMQSSNALKIFDSLNSRCTIKSSNTKTSRTRLSIMHDCALECWGLDLANVALTTAYKRKGDNSFNDKLTTRAATMQQLTTAWKGMAGSQKSFLDSNETTLDRNRELTETIKTQSEKIILLAFRDGEPLALRGRNHVQAQDPGPQVEEDCHRRQRRRIDCLTSGIITRW